MTGLPAASISLDLDDLWTYLRVQGDPRWRHRPSYLRQFVPLALELLAQLELRVTFFIVGADAARPDNADALRAIVEAGHEVGNHSFEHESWLHVYTREAVAAEVERAEAAIEAATAVRPRGFRGPGYSWSPALLDVLARRGYSYDASSLPTFVGPLARWYYFRAARLTVAERAARRLLFGKFSDGFQPLSPHWLQLPSGSRLLEVPVTTAPVFRTPFHPSYLLYISRYSAPLMRAYRGAVLGLCRLAGVAPSVLLHPLDLLGADDVSGLAFFPGMDLPGARKRELVLESLSEIASRYKLLPLAEYTSGLDGAGLRTRVVRRER